MIADNIRNASQYYGLGGNIEKGLKFLAETDLSKLELGRHEIDDTECFAIVMEYETKPLESCVWEAHRKYTDIQFIASGEEKIGYADIETLTVTQPYDETKDAELLAGEGDILTFKAGTFAIFTPEDAHMPLVAVNGPGHVRKIVIKVRVG